MEIGSLQFRGVTCTKMSIEDRGKTAVELGVKDYQTCIRKVGDMSMSYIIWYH